MKKKSGIIGLIFVLLLLTFSSGCTNSRKMEIYGGDIVKIHVMHVSSLNSALSYELPVISTVEIDDFKIDQYYVNGEGDYTIEYENITGGNKYRDFYYYFVHILVDVSDDTPADFSIESVDMFINGEIVNYKIDDMRFTNTKAQYNNWKDDEDDFVYSSDLTFLYQTIPDETTQYIYLEAQSDCVIKDFGALDYLNIENLEIYVNNKKVSLGKDIQVYKGDEVKISFNLSYKDNASAESLLKTTRYITYANKNGEECVFADAQGFMVINYIDDTFIKQYIDNKLRK